jgi:methylglutaconyl-CoA hydratase
MGAKRKKKTKKAARKKSSKSAPGSLVLVEDAGCVRWLTLNRPEKRNALSEELVEALSEALADAKGSKARCVAITGAGSVFCAGADLATLKDLRSASFTENLADSFLLADLLLDICEHPLPVIAAVNGHALGGGAGLAAACDITVAQKSAKIGFTEVRIGFVPAIVLNFLLRTVGEKAARELCLTGRPISAEEGAAMGLVNRVVSATALKGAVKALGEEIAQCGPQAIATTKALFLKLGPLSLKEGLDQAAQANAEARESEDCLEGVDAFLEKRKPRWSNRTPS